jgi:uncharacterized protein
MPRLQKFSIPAPAGVLEGIWHLPDEAPRAIAVVAHPLPVMGGTMDNKVVTTLARTFAELGFAALRFNFRGVGASTGVFDSGNGEVEDALAVVRYAKEEQGGLPLVLAGFSFGGIVQVRSRTNWFWSHQRWGATRCRRCRTTPWSYTVNWTR